MGCRTPPQLHTGGVGQQQLYGGNVFEYGSRNGFVCCVYFPHVVDVSALSICIVLCAFVVIFYVFVICEFRIDSQPITMFDVPYQ